LGFEARKAIQVKPGARCPLWVKADMCSALQRKIRIVPSENPDFLQAWRLRTRLLVMVEVGDQSLTNAEVYFQQSAARNKPNAWTFHRGAVANNSLQSSN